MKQRTVAVLIHTSRADAVVKAVSFIAALDEMGFAFLIQDQHLDEVRAAVPTATIRQLNGEPAEVCVVFGGDGTILKAAEWAKPLGVPLLGVNLGHVGFLAEMEPSDLDELPGVVAESGYHVEERLTLQVSVLDAAGTKTWSSTAVNEVSLEKVARERMLSVMVSIDERPLSLWGCDGVLVATPSGSTAYSFSAGGPVVWPDVQAIVVVPLAAHALFNRPMVLSPSSRVSLDLPEDATTPGILWCDGRRSHELAPGERIRVTADPEPLKIARLGVQPFTTRLVKKFALPVDGWRRKNG